MNFATKVDWNSDIIFSSPMTGTLKSKLIVLIVKKRSNTTKKYMISTLLKKKKKVLKFNTQEKVKQTQAIVFVLIISNKKK